MGKNETLGYFKYKNNGEIYVKMGSNMRFESEAVTYIHELYHDRLSNFSLLGNFLNFIGMAWEISGEDNKHILDKYGDVLVKHTRKVQEVYASSMTWLWLKREGNEEYRKIYIDIEIEKEEYKKYRKELELVISNEKISLEEREKIVDTICRYALNADLNEENFWNCINDVDAFDTYIGTAIKPEDRMNYAYNKVITEGGLIQEKEIDQMAFIERLCSLELFRNVSSYIEMAREQVPKISMDSNILEKYRFLREKKIKVFDLSALQVYRGEHNINEDIDAFCIIKNCQNLEDKEKNFYVIKHSNYKGKSIYLSQELSMIQDIVEDSDFVIIPFVEYDKHKWKPTYFETNRTIFVILDNYDECAQWGRELLDDGEVYWGDIYSKNVNNFFTVNFFVRRGKKDVIFVFPTTKKLAISLQNELGIEKYVLYSNQEEFFKIFGSFQNQVDIFRVYRNLMAFILDSTGSFVADTALRAMSIDVVRTITNSCLNIYTPNNCFEQMMYFPTKQTIGNGKVWLLMEFQEGERCGNIKSETVNIETKRGEIIEIKGILVFNNKMDAIIYLRQRSGLEYYHPVEMDLIFWNYFKPKLIQSEWKIFLYNGMVENGVQVISEERLEYMLYTE